MSKALKTYGWQGNRFECPPAPNGGQQTREIVAATSAAAAARAAGLQRASQLWNLGVTGNADEIALAQASPGTVYWQPLVSGRPSTGWTEAGGKFGAAVAPAVPALPTAMCARFNSIVNAYGLHADDAAWLFDAIAKANK